MSWWCGVSRAELSKEVARRFAVNRAEGTPSFALATDRAKRAAAARWRQRGLGTFPAKPAADSRGSVLMPKADTLRSEFVQERVSMSDLRSAGWR
jgi:hypothetical protein